MKRRVFLSATAPSTRHPLPIGLSCWLASTSRQCEGQTDRAGRQGRASLPPFGICEVHKPFTVQPLGGEGTIQHVAGNDGVVARVDRTSPSTRSGSEALLTHQPFDPVQATIKNFCKHIAADKARTLSPVAHQKTLRDTAAKHSVTFAPL